MRLMLFSRSGGGLGPTCMVLRNLCDAEQVGQLNSEQFALAMYMIEQKVQGVPLPQTLLPNYIPPSMRTLSAPVAAFSPEPALKKESPRPPPAQPAPPPPTSALQDAEVQQAFKELDAIKQARHEAEGSLEMIARDKAEVAAKLSDVQKELDNENKAVEDLRREIDKTRAATQSQEGDLKKIQAENELLKTEEAKLRRTLKVRRQERKIKALSIYLLIWCVGCQGKTGRGGNPA